MTQSATAVPTTAPTVGAAIEVGLTYQMLGSRGSWHSGPGRRVAGGPAADAAALTTPGPANKVVGSG